MISHHIILVVSPFILASKINRITIWKILIHTWKRTCLSFSNIINFVQWQFKTNAWLWHHMAPQT